MTLASSVIETPCGPFTVVTDADGACAAGFAADAALLFGVEPPIAGASPEHVVAPLVAYFAGELDALDDMPISPGALQRGALAVLIRALRAVPAGETVTYRELAARAGVGSPRVAGRACALNPLAVIVPCHRAVGTDGTLRGYRWGLERKEWLLRHEEQSAQ
jgi:methylated-DNA-[protein]-cysteine S-methyltransferase